MEPPLIALLTDYGQQDAYVGIMHSVILNLCPAAKIVDLSHDVPPQNVLSGAYLLSSAVDYLPERTIIVAVVDPGVGSDRRALAIRTDRLVLIGPDNGIFTMVLKEYLPRLIVSLDNPHYFLPQVSTTFHGRDLFAPAAAHVANGVPLDLIGSWIPPDSQVKLENVEPVVQPDQILCHVVHVDRFGNLITDLESALFARWLFHQHARIRIENQEVPLRQTFSDVAEGDPVAYFGSSGHLEIAIRNGSAAQTFGLGQHALIRVQR